MLFPSKYHSFEFYLTHQRDFLTWFYRVQLEYDRLKAELNSLEDEKSNSAKEQQRLRNEISEMRIIVDQLQLKIRESKEENSRLELQKIKLQNFVKNFQDKNLEFNKVK